MTILWRGQACFQIIAQPAKNSQVRLVIDPYSEEIGLKLPRMEADIVLATHGHYDHNNVKAVAGSPFIIEGPGEYEVKGAFLQGISSWHDQEQGAKRGTNTIYTIDVEEMRVCHLGDLGQQELTSEQLEKIGDVDVLMLPVGSVYTIDAKAAVKIITQIEPKITIPMHYALPKLKVRLEGVDKFLKTIGVKKIAPEPKLSIKKKGLSDQEAKIVVLEP